VALEEIKVVDGSSGHQGMGPPRTSRAVSKSLVSR
jgi:hypothetical protein